MIPPSSLGDRISRIVELEYDQLRGSSKPIERPNGLKEWTVVSAVLAINRLTDEIRIISIATGVKTIPDKELTRSNGKIVHDCHAEILAIRSFNTVLLKQMELLESNTDNAICDLITRGKDGLFSWVESNELALYISRVPCGDASMESLSTASGDNLNENLEDYLRENDDLQYIDPHNKTTLRGRMNYRKLGVTRTKPGRLDSDLSLSKSCSDKLAIKQITSLTQGLTYSLLETPIYLKYLVIPKAHMVANYGSLNRCFHERLQKITYPIKHFEFLMCNNQLGCDLSTNSDVVSLLSGIKLFITPTREYEETLLNGVKNGFYRKGINNPLRKNCESQVSRYAQWQLYKKLRAVQTAECSTYVKCKTNSARATVVQAVKEHLSPDGWISTQIDDFQ